MRLNNLKTRTAINAKISGLVIYAEARKFYIRRNNNKVDSIKTGRIVIAHLLPEVI